METKEMLVINADKIASATGYKSEEVAIIKNTIAKGTTDTEVAYFLSFCKAVDLNPFLKEIWCYKDGKGNLLVFAGRDGFLKKAQQDSRWNGMTSSYVCENDDFTIDMANGIVNHSFGIKDRGNVVGAFCKIKPKGCEMSTVSWADIKDYDKGYNVWKSNKGAMIQKVAETQALKKAFGISGLQSEYDFIVQDGVAINQSVIQEDYSLDRLVELFNQVKDNMLPDDVINVERIINNQEKLSYRKVIIHLKNIINGSNPQQ